MEALNIAIVCDPISHLTAGSIVSTLRFAEHLKNRGHRIIFIAAKDKDKRKVGYFNGFKVYRFASFALPGSKGQYLLSFPKIKRIKKILVHEKINIVHLIDPTPSSIQSLRAAKSLGIKVVAHSHTQPENMLLQIPKIIQSERLNNLFYNYMIRIYRKADAVICPSKFAERMLKMYDPKLNLFVISNGVNLSKFKKVNFKPFIEKYKLYENNKKILYVGRLHMEKSVHTLIQAMPFILKNLKNVDLYLIGAGHLQESLEKLAKRLGVKNNVKFFGKIPHEDLLMAYNACDTFILPSIAELEGMVVLEAMACSKPIIISDSKLSASPEFVNNNGFTFQLQNPRDLAEKTLILLKNKELRNKMGNESYRQIKDYDINKSVDKLESIYKKVLA